MFTNKENKFFYESSVWEEYEDFVYYVSWGENEKAVNEAIKKEIKVNEVVWPNGDGVLHVCAEYGWVELF